MVEIAHRAMTTIPSIAQHLPALHPPGAREIHHFDVACVQVDIGSGKWSIQPVPSPAGNKRVPAPVGARSPSRHSNPVTSQP